MRKIILIIITFLFTTNYIYSQEFSCPQVDCTGQCGAFFDGNNDGFCDHGQLSEKVKAAQRKLKEEQAAKEKQETKSTEPVQVAKKADVPSVVSAAADTAVTPSAETDTISEPESKKFDTSDVVFMPKPPARVAPKYHLLSITISLIVLYIISLIFVKKNLLTKRVNHIIWNVALAISFFVSGILGMVLVFWLNYGYHPDCYLTIKVLHVEFGIAMAVISMFHFLWHLNYFAKIFK